MRPPPDALAFLAGLSQALAVSIDLDETLALAVHRIIDFMQAEAASLFLLDEKAAEPTLECRICAGPIDVRGLRVAVGQGVVGRAVAENALQVVADATTDPRVWRPVDRPDMPPACSLACAPLRTAAGPIGALEIINRLDGRPFTRADAELLDVIAAPAALAIGNARMARELLAQQRLRREFELARRLQRSLLPRRRRDWPVAAVNCPAHEISGDFYDFFELPDGRIGFVVGDVSGKGMDAALLMVRAASLLRWIGKDGLAPGAWLARANAELLATARDGRFVCALVGACDVAASRVTWASAGFPPVLIERDGRFERSLAGGPPLAVLAEARFTEESRELAGGTFVAFSDGATDVRDAAGEPIGVAGFEALLGTTREVPPRRRLRRLLQALRRRRLVDDTTLLAIRAPVAELLLEAHVPARADALRGLRAKARRRLRGHGIAPALVEQLLLAVDEACTNIIRHAYGEDADGRIALRIFGRGPELEFELDDEAPCVDPDCIRPRAFDPERPGGLGLALIERVMDGWSIRPDERGCGNHLRMHRRIGRGEWA